MAVKVEIASLVIELTRRCNQACIHCMRGDAQNVDITKEMIDNLFKNDDHEIVKIHSLIFTGGEPFLNKEIYIYIINYIISNKIEVEFFSMYTNGLVYDEEIMTTLADFEKYCFTSVICKIDQFHQLLPDNLVQMYLNGNSPVKYMIQNLNPYEIVNFGRARENNLGEKIYSNLIEETFWKTNNYKLDIMYIDDIVYIQNCYLTAKGKFGNVSGDGEFDMIDKICTTDIINDSLFKNVSLKNCETRTLLKIAHELGDSEIENILFKYNITKEDEVLLSQFKSYIEETIYDYLPDNGIIKTLKDK